MYLRKNETHSLHRPKRKKFPRRKIMTHYPGQIVQSDLIDMQQFSRVNSGFNYILVVIDCFSKFLWCIPLRTKTAKDNRQIDILEDLTINYNNTYHKSIKMKPIEVTWENRKKVFKTLYPKKSFKVHCRLNKGDKVRIALNKNIFDKGFTQNWEKKFLKQ